MKVQRRCLVPSFQNGDLRFPADPTTTAAFSCPLWRPDLFHETVIVGGVPHGYIGGSDLDPSNLPIDVSRQDDAGGLHLRASDEEGDLALWLPHGTQPVRPAFIVPIDDGLEIRLHSLQRAYRWLKGEPAGPVMRRQKLSAFHRHRFVQMLRLIDGLRAGASKREVASVLFSRDVRILSAVDWRNTSERRQLARLVAEANEYIEAGYLSILTGLATKGHLFRRGR